MHRIIEMLTIHDPNYDWMNLQELSGQEFSRMRQILTYKTPMLGHLIEVFTVRLSFPKYALYANET